MKSFKLTLFCLVICFQINAQKTEALKEINKQIWQPFTTAFETSNYEMFGSIHSPMLLRVSGDQKTIRFFESYIGGYKTRWENSKRKQTISFRFIERIPNDDFASERGIYKLTVDLGSEQERSFYGQFHVLHKKIDGRWKIILDYDSSENNTINEASYTAAYAIDDFENY